MQFNNYPDGSYGVPDAILGKFVFELKPDSVTGFGAGVYQLSKYTNGTNYSLGTDLGSFKVGDTLTFSSSKTGATFTYTNFGHGLIIYKLVNQPTLYESFSKAMQNNAARMLMGPLPPRKPGSAFGF